MTRAIKVMFALWVILIVILVGLAGYVQFNADVQSGSLLRQAAPRLLLGGGQSHVTLTRLAQPVVTCPPSRRATNIVLLIDQSGSMADNDAMSAALLAASQFVSTVDLNATRVAVLFFNEGTTLAQSSTQDGLLLQNILEQPVTPDGGTDIAHALIEAQSVLNMAQAPATAVPIIILLTDGGSDPQAATQTAQTLKDGGVRLITISLLTEDSNPDLLRVLASSSTDYYETPAPANLQGIYAGLAEEINTAVAFNVTITETIKPGLTVITDSLQPAGNVAGNQIIWELPNLSQEEAQFSYVVGASRWGFYTLNEEDTTMSYTDCIAGAVTTNLAGGLALLVLPPIWLLAVVALLPLLPMVLMAWFKRPKTVPASTQPEPVKPVEPEPPPDPYPAWLKRLDDNRKTLVAAEMATTTDELTPTIIIGIGPAGRVVLSQVAQTLRARYAGRLPAMVRLLQIDVQPKGVVGLSLDCPDYLEPEEWVLLQPDLAEITRTVQRNPADWPHLAWYEATAAVDYGRARGRIALFNDLKSGADRSIVWQSITRAAAKLQRPRLRLVGSTFDDVSSGMLVDVAWLIQLFTGSQVDVELWLTDSFNQPWSSRLPNPRQLIPVNEQKERSLATLRELERFQCNLPVPFHYVTTGHIQTQFRSVATAAVVQTLFLFTPVNDQTSPDDHLGTISDSLLAALHTQAQQALNQHLSRTGARASELTNKQGMGMVCSLGAYAIRMPLGLLEEALTWRMVYELLFEERVGLLPQRRLLLDGTYEPLDLADLSDNPAQRREAAERFVWQYRRRWQTPDFFYALAHHTGDLLNGEGSGVEPSLARVGGLPKAIRWLEAVRNQLNIEGQSQTAQIVNSLRQQLDEWQTFLLEAALPFVEQKWAQSRHTLAQLSKQGGRQWAIPSGLEWPIYQQRIRGWIDALPLTFAIEPLARAAQRFGWSLTYHENHRQWRANFWLPPGEFVWNGPDSLGDTHRFVPLKEARPFLQQLYHLVVPLSRYRAGAQLALDHAERLDKQLWLDWAVPRLPFNETDAGRLMNPTGGVSELSILVAPKLDRSFALEQELENTPNKPKVTLCPVEDESSVILLRVRDRIPLQTYEQGYGDEAWRNQFVPGGLYVWRGEQLAAALEGDRRLGPLFVGWLEQDARLVDLFARAYLFSLLELRGSRLELPGLGDWSGGAVGVGLGNLFSADSENWPDTFLRPERRARALEGLAQALDAAQKEIWRNPGKRIYLRQAEEKLLTPLMNSQDGRERDLAIYLLGIIKKL